MVKDGNRALVDVGNADGEPSRAGSRLIADGKPAGDLEVSVVTPAQYAARVKRQAGVDVLVMREGGDVLANTLPGRGEGDRSRRGTALATIDDQRYRTLRVHEARLPRRAREDRGARARAPPR